MLTVLGFALGAYVGTKYQKEIVMATVIAKGVFRSKVKS